MLPEPLEQRTIAVQQWGRQICQAMTAAMIKLGFSDELTPLIQFDEAKFELSTDPYTQKQALKGTWYRNNQHKLGEIIFHIDGSFYAEYDVVRPHPGDKRWFVEAMTAWGREDIIKTDAKLLPTQGT